MDPVTLYKPNRQVDLVKLGDARVLKHEKLWFKSHGLTAAYGWA